MTALEQQIAGNHYKRLAIQPVEFTMSNQMQFCEGNVIKYVTRWRDKGGMKDLRKAAHFIDFILENEPYRHQFTVHRPLYIIGEQMGAISAEHYILSNGIENPAAGVIRYIWLWNISGRLGQLYSAQKWMADLIDTALAEDWR